MDLIIVSIYDSGFMWSAWVNGEEFDRNHNKKNIDFKKINISNPDEIISYLYEIFYLQKSFCKLIICDNGCIEVKSYINFNSSEIDEGFKKIICIKTEEYKNNDR